MLAPASNMGSITAICHAPLTVGTRQGLGDASGTVDVLLASQPFFTLSWRRRNFESRSGIPRRTNTVTFSLKIAKTAQHSDMMSPASLQRSKVYLLVSEAAAWPF
jgi:hypothetical protein